MIIILVQYITELPPFNTLVYGVNLHEWSKCLWQSCLPFLFHFNLEQKFFVIKYQIVQGNIS